MRMTGPGRLLTAVGHAFWRPWLRRRLGRSVVEEVEGLELVVLPEVFNPAVFRSGALLARTVACHPALQPSAAGDQALDMGTGSGVGALFAARRGYRVTAVDVNPAAVRCAGANAVLHGLAPRIEVLHGDLFAPVRGRRFDLILFNPPYFRGRPARPLDAAWRGEDVLERFADGLPGALAAGGRALLLLSTDGEGEALIGSLETAGLTVGTAARQEFGNEVLTAYLATAAVGSAAAAEAAEGAG